MNHLVMRLALATGASDVDCSIRPDLFPCEPFPCNHESMNYDVVHGSRPEEMVQR